MFFLKFFKSAFVWQVPSIVVRDVPHHHGGFSSAKRPGNRKRCMSGCGWGAVDLWELRHASYSPFDVHRFTLTLKGTHISHVKKKHDTSSPKVATFCKRLDFCFQEWYSTLSRGKCYINPLHTVWDSHPPPPETATSMFSLSVSRCFFPMVFWQKDPSFSRLLSSLQTPETSLASVPSSGSGSSFGTSWRNVINSL